MARFKQVTDDEIIGAALDVIAESGPAFTLAEVGDRVGLSAATIVQRFETKRALRIRIAQARTRRGLDLVIDGEGHPLDRLAYGLAATSSWMKTPCRVGNAMAVLINDMSDPEFRSLASSGLDRRRDQIIDVFQQAIDSGHMKQCDVFVAARHMQTAIFGAHQTWALEPEGELVDWIAKCARDSVAQWRIDMD